VNPLGVRSRIGLGTNRLTHTPEHVAFVREAVAAGIGMVDTAHIYAGGESEATIGEALPAPPAGCVVATKGGYNDGRPGAIGAEIEESLRRLRTEAIGLYYLHKVDPEVPLEESLGAIKEHQERGSIRLVGVSNVSVEQIERARRVVEVAAVQNHYSLAERTHDDVVDHCGENGIAFVPYFPLRGVDDRSPQAALAWLLERSPAMLPIPGTLSLEHVRENLAAATAVG
jgi:aryl-alcohol dehydrogenase-like predicted oxidoreductase